MTAQIEAQTALSAADKAHTVEEYLALPFRSDENYELIRGELIPMPPPEFPHGKIVATLSRYLGNYVYEEKLGEVTSGSRYVINKALDFVPAPDVAFLSTSRIPAEKIYPLPAVPDLVVEVVSTNDVWTKVDDKVEDYLASGVQIVWVIYPRREAVFVHRPGQVMKLLIGSAAHLDGEEILQGFKLALKALFE